MGRRRNDPAEDEWIRANYPHIKVEEAARLFEERFGRPIKPTTLTARASDLGVHRDTGAVSWASHPEWREWMADYIPGHSERETIAAFKERWGVELRVSQVANFKTRFGIKSGTVGGRFVKGQEPSNKGRPISEWMTPEAIERTKATRFKKNGIPRNTRPMGFERVNVDGYIEVKVRERPDAEHKSCFDLKHRLVYERAHGVKLTSDDVIVFLDGDKSNCDPSNLARLSHAEHAKMTTYKLTYSDRETFETALNIMRLNDRVRSLTGRERVCPVCGKTFKPANPNNPSRCCSTKCAGEYKRGKPRSRKESNGTTR